jgi:hypothetical protein
VQLNLTNTRLCGVWFYKGMPTGTYNAEGITAVADALRVNSSLTECNLNYNSIDSEGKASIRNAVQGKAGFELRL